MADLRARFLEDYAGGFLNISRQELSSNGEILSQDGFLTDSTIFVEDGTGTKSGLRLGIGLVESVDPTTQNGVVNVRYADRTYTKIRDTKIFATAIASAQAALSEAVSESFTNVESAIDLIDSNLTGLGNRFSNLESGLDSLTNRLAQAENGGSTTDQILAIEIRHILDTIGIPSVTTPSTGGGTATGGTTDGGTTIIIGGSPVSDGTSGSGLTDTGSGVPAPVFNILGGEISPEIIYPNGTLSEGFGDNVKLGRAALSELDTGVLNTAIGINSLRDLRVGSSNTALGESSGIGLVNGNNNIYIGAGASPTKANVDNEIVIGSRRTRYLETSVEAYTPAAARSQSDTVSDIDKTSEDNLWKYYYFISDLVYRTITWADTGEVSMVIEPQSVKESQEKHSLSGFVNIEAGTISKTKFIPIALMLIEHIYNVVRRDIDGVYEFNRQAALLHDNLLSRVNGLESTVNSYGSIPIGGIIMWSGDQIPYGWTLCNGITVNGIEVPDLRDKFIIGSGKNFGTNSFKNEEPMVVKHRHETSASFPVMQEMVYAPGAPDSYVTGKNVSWESILGYGGPPERPNDGYNESPAITVYPTINEPEVGGLGSDTYPPYYALAFIMRIL